MTNSQVNIFDFIEEEETTNKTPFLHIIKDGTPTTLDVESLFDSTKYDTAHIVTFVSSPTFIFETLQDYQHVELILGIGDGNVSEQFSNKMNVLLDTYDLEERKRFFDELTEDNKEKIINKTFNIMYSLTGNPIHSKLYLLSNSLTDETRVMIGSANFTQTAFSNTKQYEELIIFDNSELFHQYTERFIEIRKKSADYIPEKFKVKNDFYADADTLKDVLLDEIEKLEDVDIHIHVSQEDMEIFKDVNHVKNKQQEELSKQDKLKEVIEVTTTKIRNENAYKLQRPEILNRKANALKKIYVKRSKKALDETSLVNRLELEYHNANDMLYLKSETDHNKNTYKMYSAQQTDEKIREQIHLIVQFIETYDKYAVNQDKKTIIENQSKVLESIMYAFTSPFIWKMKDHHALMTGNDSSRREFLSFLTIGGRSNSGKTKLLDFITFLMGVSSQYYDFNDIRKTADLHALMDSSNVMPIFSDEIIAAFFSHARYEGFIKRMGGNIKGKHPVLIGTTNHSHFNGKEQVTSRIYYLNFNHAFNQDKKKQATEELNQLYEKIDDSLFKDFSFKFSNYIKHKETFYETSDMLLIARKLFKEYFTIAHLDLPKWFPDKMFNDYKMNASGVWNEIYHSNKETFQENGPFIRVQLGDVSDDLRNISAPNRRLLLNLLPEECIKDDTYTLILHKDAFFNFLSYGQDNFMNEHHNFFSKLIGLFKG